MLRAEDVSRYFLAKQGAETGEAISNLKVQKLCYYAQGFALAILGKPLFFEDIEHWPEGPVVPILYQRYKPHEAGPIPPPNDLDLKLYDRETIDLLDKVYQIYGQFSAWKLRSKTHSEPPWMNTPENCPITYIQLRAYFESVVDSIQPSIEHNQEPSDQADLAAKMESDLEFRELTQRGLDAIAAGQYSKLEDMKRRLNDV